MDKNKWKLVIIIVISAILLIIVIQNTQPVEARFLTMRVQMPVIMLLFFTIAGGFILGIAVSLYVNKNKEKKE